MSSEITTLSGGESPVAEVVTFSAGIGFIAQYFTAGIKSPDSLADIDFTGRPDAAAVIDRIDIDPTTEPFWKDGPADTFAARYTGDLKIGTGGTYTFRLASDDGAALYIDGKLVIDHDIDHRFNVIESTIKLAPGAHQIELRYFEGGGAQGLELHWAGPDTGGMFGAVTGAAVGHGATTIETTYGETVGLAVDGGFISGDSSAFAERAPLPMGEAGVLDVPEDGAAIGVTGQRVTTLTLPDGDAGTVRIVTQPEHGHVSVNPDGTIALVLTGSDHVGALSFDYEVVDAKGVATARTVALDVAPSPETEGWGTGENHYMLATDADDRVIVEHGDVHRTLYVSNSEDALTAADIAAREGVDVSVVTGKWLYEKGLTQYGATEGMALAEDIGMDLWARITPLDSQTSNWLLLERGYSYDVGKSAIPRGAGGESALAPLYVGAWGEGDRPEITNSFSIRAVASHNVVVQDLKLSDGAALQGDNSNVIFDHVTLSGSDFNIQGNPDGGAHGVTIRNTTVLDAYYDTPQNDGDAWGPSANRASGIFVHLTEGLLLENNLFDHSGWADDFRADASIEGGQPPSSLSHNIYIQRTTTDVTMRDSFSTRSASVGGQFRGGAFLADNVFLDSNIAFSVGGGALVEGDPALVGNFSLLLGNLVSEAAWRGEGLPRIGALDWGIQNEGKSATLSGNIVANANDPDDMLDVTLGSASVTHQYGADGAFYDDTVIWRWGKTVDNIDGLDLPTLAATSVQRYAAALLGQPTATLEDYIDHLRSLDGDGYAAAAQDLLAYFRASFGLDDGERAAAAVLRFVPDEIGDGVRWDNRLNWSTGDLPGTRAGDSVHLGGNQVIFGGTVTVKDLAYGAQGGLTVTQGKLTVTGGMTAPDKGATLDISKAGQLWVEGYAGSGLLEAEVTGGRFVNTGHVAGPVAMTVSGGQALLAADAAAYTVGAGSQLKIVGDDARVGFDGKAGGIGILDLDAGGVLAYAAEDGGIGFLGEFRSGAFGDAPKVRSGVELGDATLKLDVAGLSAGTYVLMDVDELIGEFGKVSVTGLSGLDAAVVVDYRADAVRLTLSAGSGTVKVSTLGTETEAGDSGLLDALKAIRDGAPPAPDKPDAGSVIDGGLGPVEGLDDLAGLDPARTIGAYGTAQVDLRGVTIEIGAEFINPVVFAMLPSQNGCDPAVVQVSDIGSSSFTLSLQEQSNLGGEHLLETVSWIVLEAGSWTLSDGTLLQVGEATSDAPGKFVGVGFDAAFESAPAVFTQIQDGADSDWAVTRQKNAGARGFNLMVQEEEARAGSGRPAESVGWFAIDRGAGTWDGHLFEAATTGQTIRSGLREWTPFEFTQDFQETPTLLASMASFAGADPAGLRYGRLDADGFGLRVMEETSRDAEISHKLESAHVFAIEGEGLLTGHAWLAA